MIDLPTEEYKACKLRVKAPLGMDAFFNNGNAPSMVIPFQNSIG